MKTVAFLWWEEEVKFDRETPFDKEWKNKDYAEYTEMLEDRGLEVVCSEYRGYDSGQMEKAFHFNGDKWQKVENIEIDGVYDLFRHDKEKYDVKQAMEDEVGILNHPEVAELCQDKLETYEMFSEYLPETREASKNNIEFMLENYGRAVLKPRFGSSGEGIRILKEVPDNIPDDMLVQRFMESDDLPEFNIQGPHDLRILVVSGKPIGAYFRVPDEGLVSNVALGGRKIYVELDNLPGELFDMVDEVGAELEAYDPTIYTVDFMFSDGKAWIVELNSQPGVYYHGKGREKDWERPWMEEICNIIAQKFS